jgi:photosystem II stability/assembly factor-like uncharacterized protein
MLSDDGGKSWSERTPPAAIIDLAIDPDDPSRILASTEVGLAISEDEGGSWRPVEGEIGLLAWPVAGSLYLIDAAGRVGVSEEPGEDWRGVGAIGGQPVALIATGRDELYTALPNGTVKRSSDGGRSWNVRASL